MYIEKKSGSKNGNARIGWVKFSKTGRTMFYKGLTFLKTKSGYKYNCIEVESNELYWISGCKQDGSDRLFGGLATEIDADAREHYWTVIRKLPDLKHLHISN